MYYSNGLEYIVQGYNIGNSYFTISYFSKSVDDNYAFNPTEQLIIEPIYARATSFPGYKKLQNYLSTYSIDHSSIPEIFLNPTRPKTRFIDDNNEVRTIVEETFELMMKEKLPENISINILPFPEFKSLHSAFGAWNNGILGFSINGNKKSIFVRENHLDALLLVIGHEIGHVLTDTLPNKHDEEAKAFAFSIEWAKTIKENNVANLSLNIKDEIDFNPARNGLHDVAFGFVDFIIKKGKQAIDVHRDLIRGYLSVFDKIY